VDRASEIRDEHHRSREDGHEHEVAAGVVGFDLLSERRDALPDLALREVDLADPRIAR
jgi:hypothetical protein